MEERRDLPMPFGWYAVAFADEVEPGNTKCVHYFDRGLVIFRGESSAVAVVDAHCPHLGAHLGHGGTVVGDRIRCPFHAWEFDGRGRCEHIPYAKRIPPKLKNEGALFSYPCVETNGVIWVWYHPRRAQPSFEVATLEEIGSDDWTAFRIFDWEVDAAVQEAAENAADAAHFTYVHSSKDVPMGEVHHEGVMRRANYTALAPAMDENGNLDTTGTKWRESFLETCNKGPGQTWQRFTGLSNTLMLGLITPIHAKRFHLRFAFSQHTNLDHTQKLIAEALVSEICRQVEQDVPIWNHKIYRPEPNLCDGDGPIAEFRKWFSQFYAD